jgi:hypothetical protein
MHVFFCAHACVQIVHKHTCIIACTQRYPLFLLHTHTHAHTHVCVCVCLCACSAYGDFGVKVSKWQRTAGKKMLKRLSY